MPIAIRYPLVELLTAGLYLVSWGRFALPLAPIFWIFLSLLVAATFIDFDHLIIPDEITLGGAVAGLLCATLFPQLLGAALWWEGLLLSALGAAAGYFLLWGVVELGKLAFGKRRIRAGGVGGSDEENMGVLAFEITGSDAEPLLKLGEESLPLAEFFYRESDKVKATCAWLEIDGARLDSGTLSIGCTTIRYGAREWLTCDLQDALPIRAEVTEVILPREAMGFGDVKFLACIGAFLGWKGALFSLFGGSVIGALIGLSMMAMTRGRSGGRIPFGPYLALGALLWVAAGPELLHWYGAWASGGASFFLSPSRLPM